MNEQDWKTYLKFVASEDWETYLDSLAMKVCENFCNCCFPELASER